MRGMNPEAGEPPAGVHRRYLESGRLGFQRCPGCGAAVYYPRGVPLLRGCRSRLGDELERGVVYATTAVYTREDEPHNVVLVDLEVGFRMMSRVEGAPAEEVKIGARVTLRVDHEGDDPIPIFVLSDKWP